MGSQLNRQFKENTESSCDDSKSATDYDWALDYINEFIDSPIWRNPVQSFIDENCIIFDGKEEMAHVHNDIHRAYNTLVEELIVKYIHSIGLTTQQFLTALTCDGKKRLTKQIIEFILCCDDFLVFRKMMRSRNLELEQEALRMIQKGQDLPPLVPTNTMNKLSIGSDESPANGREVTTRKHFPENNRKRRPKWKNSFLDEAVMLKLAINNSLQHAEEEDLKRALEISMQLPHMNNEIRAVDNENEKDQAEDLGYSAPEPTLTTGIEESAMNDLIHPRSVPIGLPQTPNTEYDLEDAWPSTHSSSFSSSSLDGSKTTKKKSHSGSSSIIRRNEELPPLGKASIGYKNEKLSAVSLKGDKSLEPTPYQDFQDELLINVENCKDSILRQKKTIIRENQIERATRVRDYDTSKLFSAVEFLNGPNSWSKTPNGDEADEKFLERRKSLKKSLKSDFNI